jgi:hypothetical protein
LRAGCVATVHIIDDVDFTGLRPGVKEYFSYAARGNKFVVLRMDISYHTLNIIASNWHETGVYYYIQVRYMRI